MKEVQTYELNPKIPIIIFLLIIGICLTGMPFKFYKDVTSPSKISANITPIIVYKTVIVTVTPTPDGKLYYANEYETGVRKIKRPFSFFREDVSGKKDLSVHVTVYGYKIFDIVHWFNPQDYKYYLQSPSEGNKYCFVFIQEYMDDIIGGDPRMWAIDEKHFALQANNRLYYPISDFPQQIRIKELEETFNLNDDSRIGYFSTVKYYQRGHPATAGETFDNLTYLRGGKSNALDGYLIYEIPKDTRDEDLMITANFNAFGNSAWILKPQDNEGDYIPY